MIRFPFLTPFVLLFAATAALAADPPRLIVVVSVDQLAYDYLPRFKKNYSPDGIFQRFWNEGANYVNAHHRHAYTYTAPGHAVQLTGCYSRSHGIVDNYWYERETGKIINCVLDREVQIIGRPKNAKPPTAPDGVSPRNLRVETIGDRLRAKNKESKVFGVSFKDRAAVLMSGKNSSGAYWLDANTGHWVTSTFYRQELPDYIQEINDAGVGKKYLEATWNLFHPAETYRLHRPDDSKYEGDYYSIGRAFPHYMQNPKKKDELNLKRVGLSPFGNYVTLEMATAVLKEEKLGLDEVPDMLCVNLSSNDYVGHNFGPFSLEVEDMCYWTDKQLGDFARVIDQQVGAKHWTLMLTADHGVAPIAEYARDLGLPGQRDPLGDLTKLKKELANLIAAQLGDAQSEKGYVLDCADNQTFLNWDEPMLAEPNGAKARRLVADHMAKHPTVAVVATSDELKAGKPEMIRFLPNLQKSFYPPRCGDVLLCFKPYKFHGTAPATHGSPYEYDTHIPLMLWGAGIAPGEKTADACPAQLCATVGKLLGIDPPATCEEPALVEALK